MQLEFNRLAKCKQHSLRGTCTDRKVFRMDSKRVKLHLNRIIMKLHADLTERPLTLQGDCSMKEGKARTGDEFGLLDAHAVGALLVALAFGAGVAVRAVLLAVVVPEPPVLIRLLVRHLTCGAEIGDSLLGKAQPMEIKFKRAAQPVCAQQQRCHL